MLLFSDAYICITDLVEEYSAQFINRFTPDVKFWQSWITFQVDKQGYRNKKVVI
jgi:hypothetical protein